MCVCVCVCVCSQASRSRATLSCDSSYFSYWQGTIQASYAVMRQLLLIQSISHPCANMDKALSCEVNQQGQGNLTILVKL